MSGDQRLLAIYGTELDELEDEQKINIPKKPTPIQDQIVTDERGKRRFHGAFTGGFSAGYFNTVGTKEGWKPQEFRSTRDARSGLNQQKAEDFMDDDDLGEFGIGARRIHQSATFSSASALGGGISNKRMAWEHDESDKSSIAQQLENIVKPVSDSIGVSMLRSMGWREGRGVGLATIKQSRQKDNENEDEAFDRQQANLIAPGMIKNQEDELLVQLKSVETQHGLGYEGLKQVNVLDQKFGKVAAALKMKEKTKGIRGQAFGVGAFEDDDESIYTNTDLTQFDFALDHPRDEVSAFNVDSTFVQADKRLNPRKFYPAPVLPSNYRPIHTPIMMDKKKLSNSLQEEMKKMTVVQRARLLGEDRISELVGDKDRRRLEGRRSRWDQTPKEDDGNKSRSRWDQREDTSRGRKKDEKRKPFAEEPMKQARFDEYIMYLRRGLVFPQPNDLSTWQWDAEKKDFEAQLTAEERGMLPEVLSRSQPLAKSNLALPIQELMMSKFTKETGASGKSDSKDEDKRAAVKMDMFGPRTRTTFQWYPDNLLAKRFNVPNPYPGSDIVGVAHLQKVSRKETLLNLGLPNTANELAVRNERANRIVVPDPIPDDEIEENPSKEGDEEEKVERPQLSLFSAIFAMASSSSSSEDEDEKKNEEDNNKEEQGPSSIPMKIFTIDDIPEEYGPAPPPSNSSAPALSGFSVLRYLKDEMKRKKSSKKHKKDKDHKSKKSKREKHSKKHKKEKKTKKEKKKKSKSRDDSPIVLSSGSEESSSDED